MSAKKPSRAELEKLLDHFQSEADDYYWLISTRGARWMHGYGTDERTPTDIHEARIADELNRIPLRELK